MFLEKISYFFRCTIGAGKKVRREVGSSEKCDFSCNVLISLDIKVNQDNGEINGSEEGRLSTTYIVILLRDTGLVNVKDLESCVGDRDIWSQLNKLPYFDEKTPFFIILARKVL